MAKSTVASPELVELIHKPSTASTTPKPKDQ